MFGRVGCPWPGASAPDVDDPVARPPGSDNPVASAYGSDRQSAIDLRQSLPKLQRRVRAVAPGAVLALVTLADGAGSGRVHGDDDGGESGPLAAVTAVAIGKFGGQTALTVGLLSRGFLHDEGRGSVLRCAHKASR